jgi:hypothetical protein
MCFAIFPPHLLPSSAPAKKYNSRFSGLFNFSGRPPRPIFVDLICRGQNADAVPPSPAKPSKTSQIPTRARSNQRDPVKSFDLSRYNFAGAAALAPWRVIA